MSEEPRHGDDYEPRQVAATEHDLLQLSADPSLSQCPSR